MVKDSKDEARCSICGTVIKTKTGSTSGAREHLMRMHDISPEDSSTFYDPKSIPKPEEANPDNLKSFVWRYMVKVNQEEAGCSICGKVLKTKSGSTSGAREHLMRVHDIAPEDSIFQMDMKSAPKTKKANPENLKKSFIWKYMVKANNEEASCSICGKVIKTKSGSTTGAIEHLKRLHDIVPKDSITHIDMTS